MPFCFVGQLGIGVGKEPSFRLFLFQLVEDSCFLNDLIFGRLGKAWSYLIVTKDKSAIIALTLFRILDKSVWSISYCVKDAKSLGTVDSFDWIMRPNYLKCI